ncbi:MAG: hypothetical protein H7X93_02870, partial [Sphingomonadaceae bacterium]|nr:hypothetical protein [Sphingomonadaceae bacterium]
TAASPSVAVARPRDCTELEAGAELVAGDGATKLAIASVGAGDLWLDLSMLAEAGPRSATLEARFAEGDAGIAIEYVGEDATADATAAQMLRLTPASPSVTLGWLPASPFRSGYCLRWVRADGGRGPWSPPLPAGSRIALEPGRAATDAWPGAAASEPESPFDEDALDTSDLALIAAGPGEYVFRPLAPRIQIGPDGKPALQLIVAGSTGFLQLTAEWTVDAARIADLSAAIERRDGAAPRLSPAPDEVRDTALLLVPEGGGETILATGTALGVAPQTSQLAATLDAAQIALIQRGIAGERGVVKIRYRIDAGDPTRAEGSFAEVDGGAGVETMTAMRESVGEIHRHVIEITADLADALNGDPNG